MITLSKIAVSMGLALTEAILLAQGDSGQLAEPEIRVGDVLSLPSGAARVQRLETDRLIQNEYTRRFHFDSFTNPKLKELRERYELEAVVASGKDEFERQTFLLDWAHHQFKRFGHPSAEVKGALAILQAIHEGHQFHCAQFAQVFVSAAASLGWVDRELALRRHQDRPEGGSTEHSTTEIWSNQFRKWIMLDPTANMFIERNGTPLNAYEIRDEWFRHQGTNLTFVIGKEHRRYRKADLPIFLARFDGFGDLTVPADELDKYGFIGYIPNTNFMDAGLDYGQMFIVQDELCAGTRWHRRTIPSNPRTEPYFPVHQAAIQLRASGDGLRVKLATMTPNLMTFETSIDGGAWKTSSADVPWSIHAGINRLEARTVNQFGVKGPISKVELEQ